MSGLVSYVAPQVRQTLQQGEAKFRFLLGGSKAGALPVYALDRTGFLAVADNEFEINALKNTMQEESDIQFLVLGQGETTYGLAEYASEELREAIRLTANTSLHTGCGARQAIAKLATQLLEQSEDFRAFIESIPDKVYIQTQGSPRLVSAEFFFSNAGAVGLVMALCLARNFAKAVSRMDIPCHLNFDVLGPITFAGASPRARSNFAVATTTLLNYALTIDPSFENRTSKIVSFHELPPLEYDMKRRDELIVLDRLAKSSYQTKTALAISAPNDATTNRVGAIVSRDVDFYHALDRTKDIAAEVANQHFNEFKHAMSDIRTDISIVKGIEFDLRTRHPLRPLELKSIVANCGSEPIESTMQALDRPREKLSHVMRIVAAPGSVLSDVVPEYVDRTMLDYPNSVAAYVEKLSMFLTFQLIVNREIQAINKEIAILNHQTFLHKQRFAKYASRFRRKKTSDLSRELGRIANSIREAADKRENLGAQLMAAERGLRSLVNEIAFLQSNYEEILRSLDKLRPKNSLASNAPKVLAYSIDANFAALQHLPNLPMAKQVDLLCKSAGCVTRAGLAKIVGIASDRVESIAHAILYGDYPTKSPSYAGQERSFYSRQFYSVPPCDADTEALLEAAVKKLNPKAIIEFHHDITLGACVCRVTLRRFAKAGDLFPSVVGSALYDAMNDERAALNSGDGFHAVRSLGGKTNGDRVEFDDFDTHRNNGSTKPAN